MVESGGMEHFALFRGNIPKMGDDLHKTCVTFNAFVCFIVIKHLVCMTSDGLEWVSYYERLMFFFLIW